jgi:hypothetical protein
MNPLNLQKFENDNFKGGIMAEKKLRTRMVQKHDTEENWLKASGFVPKQGEIIVYDEDSNFPYERIKIGDGVNNVNILPFVHGASMVA